MWTCLAWERIDFKVHTNYFIYYFSPMSCYIDNNLRSLTVVCCNNAACWRNQTHQYQRALHPRTQIEIKNAYPCSLFKLCYCILACTLARSTGVKVGMLKMVIMGCNCRCWLGYPLQRFMPVWAIVSVETPPPRVVILADWSWHCTWRR